MILTLLLLASILLAKRVDHSPAINRWFFVQFYGTAVLSACLLLLGWQSHLYTCIYDAYTLLVLVISAGVVWEAWKTSPSA